jgi:hypothetical protein
MEPHESRILQISQYDCCRPGIVLKAPSRGKSVDCFDRGYLHLTLTKWKRTLEVAQRLIDAAVLFREALVSVFDESY